MTRPFFDEGCCEDWPRPCPYHQVRSDTLNATHDRPAPSATAPAIHLYADLSATHLHADEVRLLAAGRRPDTRIIDLPHGWLVNVADDSADHALSARWPSLHAVVLYARAHGATWAALTDDAAPVTQLPTYEH
jgi:hypothetical protein